MNKSTPLQKALRMIRRRPYKSEHALQASIVRWCQGIGAADVRNRFAAIPNGWNVQGADYKARAIAGAKLKAEGVKAGVPDMIFWGGNEVAPMWLELKNGEGGRISDKQSEMIDSLRGAGMAVHVCRTFGEAIKAITKFYGRPGNP